MEIKGLTAIVTGSTGGLGSALTLALAKAGCNCVCHYRSNQKRADELVGGIQKLGRKAAAVCASLDSTVSIEKLFADIKNVCGQAGMELPRILVNSAADFKKQPLGEVTFEDAQKMMGLNLVAPIVISKYFAKITLATEDTEKKIGSHSHFNYESPQLHAGGLTPPINGGAYGDKCQHGQQVAHPTGKIVNIVDVGGIRPWAKYSVYCASKAGLIGATKSLAKELAPAMCVNAIAPGIFSWPPGFDEAAKARQLAFIPMERIGTKEEIAAALLFLLENDYITGQVLSVDGGRGI
jgi:pteridine reductase